MRIFYSLNDITNEKIAKLLNKNKVKAPRELHLIVYQLCYYIACKYKQFNADDIACEAYMKIIKNWKLINADGLPRSYITTAAHNTYRDMIKKTKFRGRVEASIMRNAHDIIEHYYRYGND